MPRDPRGSLEVSIASPFRFWRLVLALLVTAAVFVLTHLPPEYVPKDLALQGRDKLIHAGAYALITLSFLLAVDRRARWRLPILLVLGIAAVGGVDELTQPYVGRACDPGDFVADLVGIGIAGVIVLSIGQGIRVRRRSPAVRGSLVSASSVPPG